MVRLPSLVFIFLSNYHLKRFEEAKRRRSRPWWSCPWTAWWSWYSPSWCRRCHQSPWWAATNAGQTYGVHGTRGCCFCGSKPEMLPQNSRYQTAFQFFCQEEPTKKAIPCQVRVLITQFIIQWPCLLITQWGTHPPPEGHPSYSLWPTFFMSVFTFSVTLTYNIGVWVICNSPYILSKSSLSRI